MWIAAAFSLFRKKEVFGEMRSVIGGKARQSVTILKMRGNQLPYRKNARQNLEKARQSAIYKEKEGGEY